MPTLDATTTAVFATLGISGSTFWTTITSMIGQAVSVGFWLIQATWLPLLGIGILYTLWKVAYKFTGFGRH